MILFHSNNFCCIVDEVFPIFIPDSKRVYKGFQIRRYCLFLNSNGKAVKIFKTFFWESGLWYNLSGSVHHINNFASLARCNSPSVGTKMYLQSGHVLVYSKLENLNCCLSLLMLNHVKTVNLFNKENQDKSFYQIMNAQNNNFLNYHTFQI